MRNPLHLRIRVVIGLALLTWVSPGSGPARADPGSAGYPRGFAWGVALSAHQTEGVFGGGENGDWWRFEHTTVNGKSPIAGGDTADLAVDEWHRYAEDFDLARELGVDTLRISLAWEKIEPSPGRFNEEAIDHYRAVLEAMRDRGIRPMVALHHSTHPIWFADSGGWLSDSSPARFVEYADFVVRRLGDLCDLWITFNEPMVLVDMGYLTGVTPPGVKSLVSAATAGLNLARAHRMAVARIHELQPPSAGSPSLHGVGLVNSLQLYRAKHAWQPLEWLSAGVAEEFANWAFLDAVVGGKGIQFKVQDEDGRVHDSGWRAIPNEDLRGVAGSPLIDWLGVNYYTEYQMHLTWNLKIEVLPPKGPVADNGWGIFPSGLERILRKTAAHYPKIPLVLSENGLADAKDAVRPEFVRQSLQSLDHVMLGLRPLDVRGYFHWSLMDNFEWLQGFSQRFGLVEIRYDEGLRRVPRPSFTVYHDEIAARRVPVRFAHDRWGFVR